MVSSVGKCFQHDSLQSRGALQRWLAYSTRKPMLGPSSSSQALQSLSSKGWELSRSWIKSHT